MDFKNPIGPKGDSIAVSGSTSFQSPLAKSASSSISRRPL
eukprot:CAMPEP_0117753080 /NCGR_PEP_ID=MMETSP0947-20121206/12004_1 /TAXON_ID=44440 /ORGANISM="Chattonella subsalsa, Strain CCMP2191" /LENGTH=39 /DNA_ID= /DNA_START= /DNA_END= /DNA_ORIENTATION=